MKDAIGNILQVGDLIGYPVRRGSHMWMSFGWIEEFRDHDGKIVIIERYPTGGRGKRKTLSAIDNVVRVVV